MDSDSDNGEIEVDLQVRLDDIAAKAQARNPNGFRLKPIHGNEPVFADSNRTRLNVHSGQQLVLLENAMNADKREFLIVSQV